MDKKVLGKIKKCLRLATSSNANEAATALKQAQKLMEIHGISADEVAASDVESNTTPSGAGKVPPTHIAMLVDLVCQAFGSKAVYSRHMDVSTWTLKTCIEFIGVGSSSEISAYAYHVLLRQLKRDRTGFLKMLNKRLVKATKVRRADIYCQGWVLAVSKNITPHKRSQSEENAVAKYTENRWKNKLKKREANDRSKRARQHDHSSFSDGLRDGDKVKLHQAVKGKKQKAISNGQ